VKDPEDEYEIYEFECRDGVIRFESDVSDSEIPEVGKETETFCNNCAWHDKFKKISKKGD
jgi:hypothetical protein